MGDYAEMALEREMDLDFGVQQRTRQELTVWKCRDGRAIKLNDMEDRHLCNTLAMLRVKGAAKFGDWIAAMERELLSRAAR